MTDDGVETCSGRNVRITVSVGVGIPAWGKASRRRRSSSMVFVWRTAKRSSRKSWRRGLGSHEERSRQRRGGEGVLVQHVVMRRRGWWRSIVYLPLETSVEWRSSLLEDPAEKKRLRSPLASRRQQYPLVESHSIHGSWSLRSSDACRTVEPCNTCSHNRMKRRRG